MANKLLKLFSQHALQYLDEISAYYDDFNLGQKHALVDLLESIQLNCTPDEQRQLGLDFNIEDKYKL